METNELIALLNQALSTIRLLREELAELRADNEALREELGLTSVDTLDETAPAKPEAVDVTPPDDSEPELRFSDWTTFDAADVPITKMVVQVEDDYAVRTDPIDVKRNYVLSEEEPTKVVRGSNEDAVFVDARLGPNDLNPNLIGDWEEAIIFPELPNGSSITGGEGYDAVHLKADEDANQWFRISDIEYLRVDFGPDAGGEVFGDWELPDFGYVYIDAAAQQAAVYDSSFALMDM